MKTCVFCTGSGACLNSIKPLTYVTCDWCCGRGTTENSPTDGFIKTTVAQMKALNKAKRQVT